MKKLFFFFLFSLVLNSVFAQNSGSPDNSIDNINCTCYTIVDDCSGNQLFLEGYVTLGCYFPGDRWKSYRDYPINSDGTVCIGIDDYCGDPSLCMGSGNWEVCDIDDCTIRVFQTVPINPMINGDILGYGNGNPGNSSAYGECYRLHSGPLNTIYTPSIFQLCSGDPAILTLPGMSIPAESGLCLTVTIKDLSGNLIANQSYDSGMTDGENVDITSLLTNIGDDTYIIEMRMGCCGGESTCSPNTYKYAYFRLRKGFSYQPLIAVFPLSGGTIHYETPTLVPNGPNVGNNVPVFIAFTGVNPQTSTPIAVTVTFSRKICGSEGDYLYVSSGTQTVNPGDPAFGGGFVLYDNSNCWCYKVEVKYSDGCSLGGVGQTKDVYYFRFGCEGLKKEKGDSELGGLIENRDIVDFDISIVENPIKDKLGFVWQGKNKDNSFELQIFDSSGRKVLSKKMKTIGNTMNMNFDVNPGIYFYKIYTRGKTFSGKIIKL